MRNHWRSIRIEAVLLALFGSAGEAATPAPKLPIPCAPAACGSTGPSKWVTAGSATAVSTANSLTVTQTSNSAVLNWSSFDIGAGGSVSFKQPSASSVALNKIFAANPSQIFGSLTANGQVYLINLNGFLFGPTATVNVGSLLVSTLPLNLTDANFSNGILSVGQNAVFDTTLDPLAPGVGRTSVLDANGQPVLGADGKPLAVQLTVQPGAQLTSADQGRILLTGQNVTNGGTLTSPDGQVILAAGAKVYLQADTNASLRGLLVEVDAGTPAWNLLNGIAENQQGATISTPRGNTTLVGLAVNQDGRISATTSVSANGSILLEAAYDHKYGKGANGGSTLVSTTGGALTVGPQSQMQILPDATSATIATSDTPLPSTVTLLGERVILQGGSITAPGGTLTAIAAADPSQDATDQPSGTVDSNARLRIDAGTSIDLSGSDVSLPVTANLVSAQLRSTELADDPTQRNGALHGLTVYVDARHAPSASLADVSGEIESVPETIQQKTETGGTARFESEGDAVFASGAKINVSGGETTYSGGVMQTSYLVGANGQLYPIATANPLLTYVGVVNPTFTQTYDKWGTEDVVSTPGLSYYQPGYVQGAAAGTVQFVAPTLVLQGALQGSAVNGLYQRTPSTAVSGGKLIIGLPGGAGDSNGSGVPPAVDYFDGAVRVTTASSPLVVADDASLPGPLELNLPASYLTSSGFTTTEIFSNSTFTLPAGTPLALPGGSVLSVTAGRVDVSSSITDPGGTLRFDSVNTLGPTSTLAQRAGVYLADDVTLDVRGAWTNDVPATLAGSTPAGQTWQNGGQILLDVGASGGLLSIGNDVALRASGGAWLEGSGTLVPGTGGKIELAATELDSGVDIGQNLAIDGFGVNGAAGGTFNLTAPRIEIGAGSGGWAPAQRVDDGTTPGGVFDVNAGLFSNYGFETFNLTAAGLVVPPVSATVPTAAVDTNVVTVDAGTAIDAVVGTLYLNAASLEKPSAASLQGVATVTTLAPYLRPAASITLNALPPADASNVAGSAGTSAGDISIGLGASLTTDAGGSISLIGADSIFVDGALRAPGGTVTLQIAPEANLDVGFLPTQRIDLAATGSIDVSGTFVPQPAATPSLTLGTVYAGGSVNLIAGRGAVITETGSHISLSGTSASVDVLNASGRYADEVQSTAGGNMTVFSGESISLLGGIDAAAGAQGTSGTAVAGSLNVALSRTDSRWLTPGDAALAATFNQSPLAVELVPSLAGTVAAAFDSNTAALGAAELSKAGFDALTVEAGDVFQLSGSQFAGPVSLTLGRQLIIDAPAIEAVNGAAASLAAPYVQVGYTTSPFVNTGSATGGSGSVSFSANQIDLIGATNFQGTSNVTFKSSGDLLLRGEPTGTGLDTLQGSLNVVGDLTLDAARIYPLTATTYTVTASEPAVSGSEASPASQTSSVTIGQTAANPGTPLSAGGSLLIAADDIASTGTLYAPFGQITLQAGRDLTLGDGSLTSVSAAGLTIPYGQTLLSGQEWVYDPGTGAQTVTGVPTRLVSLQAPSITLSKQAVIDLSGGGDLQAYEWVPGTGGTKDVLTANPNTGVAGSGYTAGLYAVIPSLGAGASPLDPQNSNASNIPAGETVYLSGGGGLAAGTYTLLPARYALEPGAFLIQLETQFSSTTLGSLGTLADGTPVVAGFLSYGTTGLHQTPGYVGFAVYPGSYGSELADYGLSLASTYFAAAATSAGKPRPVLPADAGTLVLDLPSLTTGVGSLSLEGQVRTAAATGGSAAAIDISATDLVIGTPGASAPADAVSLSAALLDAWQPGSVLLGGCSLADCPLTLAAGITSPTTGTDVVVSANRVTIGTGTTLTAGQIAVVANQAIDVQSGATLRTTSAATGVAPATAPAAEPVVLSSPGGGTAALLAVSDSNWLIPSRSGGLAATGAASVTVAAGATLSSLGSLTIDGIGGVTMNGTAQGKGAEWSLGSSSIAFVPAAASGLTADAFSIGPLLLSELDSAGAVRLASTGAMDVMTPVSVGVDAGGSPTLDSLTVIASSLNNATGAAATPGPAAVRFGAQTLTLEGSGGTPAAAGLAGPAGATLTLAAGVLDLGPGTLAVNGFDSTQTVVSGAVIGQGSGQLSVGGALSLVAAGVTAAAGATTTLDATGALSVSAASGSGPVPALYGGALNLQGSSIDIAGTVAAPAGLVTLTSTAGNVAIDAGAHVSTAGGVVTIQNQTVDAPGGSLTISAAGDLLVAPGARLDVSGGGSAAAGALSLAAAGSASIGGLLSGAGGTGGSFAVDAGSLPGAAALDSLAAALGAGGFTNAIDVRARAGNLALDAGSSLSANEVTLTADSGSLTVGGTLAAASGALRGSLSLFGGDGVQVTSGASLSADGAGASGRGGTIEIGAGRLVEDQSGNLGAYNAATIALDAGSTISTAGAAANGTLLLRAPALVASGDIGIRSISSTLSGVGEVILEPVLAYNTANTAIFSSATTPTAADFQAVQQSVGAYMTTAGTTIGQRLAPAGGVPLMIEPGVELIANGDLTLQSADGVSPALDLSPGGSNWRFNGAPIDLTIRAAGNLNVANSLSDGFAEQTVGTATQTTLLSGASSSIRLVAGADLSSANPLQVAGAAQASLTLGSANSTTPAVVRTGTGDVDLVAAGDIVIASAGSGAYTAGVAAAIPGATVANPAVLGTLQYAADANGNSYVTGLLVPRSNLLISYPTAGGNLLVEAGGNIDGAALSAPGVPNWQLREGGAKASSTWGVNLAAYDWNFGTLGGGDVRLTAGGSATNVTVAAADSLLPQYTGTLQYLTSGGLSLHTGADLGSAQVFLADGRGTVSAGGGLTAVLPSQTASDGVNVGSAFYLQSSTLDVTARLGVDVDGIFNPTGLGQVSGVTALAGSFLSYSDTSSLTLRSIAGDVDLGLASGGFFTLLGTQLASASGTTSGTGVAPSTLAVQALNGGITLGEGFGTVTLNPSATGQLDLLAAGNIDATQDNTSRILVMSDAVSGSYATVANPSGTTKVSDVTEAFSGDLHADDTQPALITAGGSIESLALSVPKAAQVVAGKDIADLTYLGQNLNSTDQTVLSAGRDLAYDCADCAGIEVGGPGEVDVLAGRNVAFGFSHGIVTTGNLENANLPTSQGADITIATGLGTAPDFAGFLKTIIAPTATYRADLVSYVEGLLGLSHLSFAAAETLFQGLSETQQRPLIDEVFFNDLLLSGRAANATPSVGFTQGYTAIDTLFPGSRSASADAGANAFQGDLSLTLSQIYTLSGGNIDLVVPGGQIDVGVAVEPPSAPPRTASQLGIVTEGTGNIDIYSKGDVNVNSSRIFTLGGGNILIWSDEGSIDAGRGAKTALSAPPPTVSVDNSGNITIDFAGAAVGSGIRTIQTEPSTPAGNVDLIAPEGTVNAGDAGIGSAGNINIAAASVIGVSNINFGGTATGVPAQISNVGASLSGASSAAGAASNTSTSAVAANSSEKEAAAPLAQAALSWLDVFVTGLGEDNCKPDDIDCLKRQKTATH